MRLLGQVLLGLVAVLMALAFVGAVLSSEPASVGLVAFTVAVTAGCVAGIVALRRGTARFVEGSGSDAWQADQNAKRLVMEREQRHAALLAAQQAEVAARLAAEREAAAQATLDAQQRQQHLVEKYGVDGAAKVNARELWRGAPVDAVIEMFGQPLDVDEVVSKKRVRRVLKYFQIRSNAYGLKVTVDDGFVTGWDRR